MLAFILASELDLFKPFPMLIILLIALLFFGHKLPGVARSLGLSISEFKKGVKEGDASLEQKPSASAPPAATAPAPVPPASAQSAEQAKLPNALK